MKSSTGLFRKKSIQSFVQDAQTKSKLQRNLTAWDLALLGIGAIIGTGIFVLTGTGALQAGPALTISFLLAGLACAFAALCYAEFASLVPASGSVYTYSYATLGELIAWVIGWDLVLEYLFAVSSVAVGWSGYFQNLLSGFGLHFPKALTAAYDPDQGTLFNLPAVLIVLFITFLLATGIQASKKLNNIMVLVKVGVVLLFILVGVFYVQPSNWVPYAPFGFGGISLAAATVFFAYIGFDAVASAAEETKNPQRDLPRGILWSLGICTLLYVVVSAIMTGAVPYGQFKGIAHPASFVMDQVGQNWVAGFIDVGAILGLTTVILVMLYGQTRIFYAMSRDGLLPKFFSDVDEKHSTPYKATWLVGTIAALIGGVFKLDTLAEMVNIGTLFAFMLVCIGVLVLRKTEPDLPRKFKTPFVPFVPALGILFCGYLILQLQLITWIAFGIWFVIGLVVYFGYSRKHSLIGQDSMKKKN
ncbi:amino acid permease [Thermoactinomyces sp. DSM 45892]|uniref:amino acid permease n=1 Tax=Thermoactinomyces sp. DSM 45892 TaxID=1882753 RepID=UPI0008966E96|nr:amino acid permease [Thermoactinomyces sp. DSM 45892]SDY58424.1 amino acid/polyamine/organocation transporter, APC superfamily [Thermoactinomyces sp. DSM 45892]